MIDMSYDQLGAPIVLTSDAVSLAEGAVKGPDLGRMLNKISVPMLISQINFLARGPDSNAGNLGSTLEVGGTIRMKLSVGKWVIAPSYVPLWLYGHTIQANQFAFGLSGRWAAAPSCGQYSRYSWIPPCPIYVPAGTPILPSFSRSTDGFGSTMTVEMACIGRRFKLGSPLPKRIKVPYVAAYVGTEATSELSPQTALRNELEADVKLQRLIGRVQTRDNATPTVMYENTLAPITTINMSVLDWNLRSVVSGGASGLARMSDIFEANRREWQCPLIVPARQSMSVRTSAVPALSTVMISMLGTREEAL